jgi:oleate hydratase
MPFVDSLFMPRTVGDRPDVIPERAANFAFMGQFTKLEDDCVFTVEYSVRCAQIALFGVFEADRGSESYL